MTNWWQHFRFNIGTRRAQHITSRVTCNCQTTTSNCVINSDISTLWENGRLNFELRFVVKMMLLDDATVRVKFQLEGLLIQICTWNRFRNAQINQWSWSASDTGFDFVVSEFLLSRLMFSKILFDWTICWTSWMMVLIDILCLLNVAKIIWISYNVAKKQIDWRGMKFWLLI